MRRKPNRSLSEDQEQAAEEFISGASAHSSSNPSAGQTESDRENATGDPLPWNQPRVREDVKQTYPLRLPEPLHLKLKYLSEETGQSMNELCNEAVESLVEERLREIL